ncbi:hypothetical protein OESDEN_05045 [Oesophagostomum dentatum]|uniref:Uncharacterized protein n=1 Tax=Oesophagostomum dentatum TaxID=61180 RepID=A0A0B1TCK7_OESDE|nr:hypothetical protein OESDEN_05045 [Oesophagostomum dentatum]
MHLNTLSFSSAYNINPIDIDQKGSYYDDYSRILYITKKHFIDLSAFTSVELTWENVKEIGSGSSACQAWLPLIICAIFIARFL